MSSKKKASQSTALSNEGQIMAVAGARALPPGIVLKRRITMPSLAMKKQGDIRYLAIADEMRVSKVPGKLRENGKRDDPATICTVGDVLTGEVFTWLVPAVCKKNLEAEYPDDSYVGHTFMIENMGKRSEGQKYHDFGLSEVDASALTKQAAAQSPQS